jgi:hypothetical protein
MHPTVLVEVSGARRRVDLVPLEADLCSDTRLLPLVEILAEAAGPGIRWMRDPARPHLLRTHDR